MKNMGHVQLLRGLLVDTKETDAFAVRRRACRPRIGQLLRFSHGGQVGLLKW
jgi:hypothetical protein